MTGYTNFNYQAFFDAEKSIIDAGFESINPARTPVARKQSIDYRDYIKISMRLVEISDRMITLPGWEKSLGATAEVAYAHALGMSVITLEDFLNENKHRD